MSIDKPPGLSGSYPSQWSDAHMAAAYPARPPYGDGLVERLLALRHGHGAVLDIGAGTGDLARPLALGGAPVEAVEPSQAMVTVGRSRRGGDRVRWNRDRIEDAELRGPYSLAVAGESVHWLEFDQAFPRVRAALAPGAPFAVAGRGDGVPPSWHLIKPVVEAFSTNWDYVPYDPVDLIVRSGWFRMRGRWEAMPITIEMPVSAYLVSLHSRNGLGPGHMGRENAAEFDEAILHILEKAHPSGRLRLEVRSWVVWGALRG